MDTFKFGVKFLLVMIALLVVTLGAGFAFAWVSAWLLVAAGLGHNAWAAELPQLAFVAAFCGTAFFTVRPTLERLRPWLFK